MNRFLPLAEETGLTTRGVQNANAELVRSGWWQVVRGGGPRSHECLRTAA